VLTDTEKKIYAVWVDGVDEAERYRPIEFRNENDARKRDPGYANLSNVFGNDKEKAVAYCISCLD
jgi:hypothetical protein